MDESAGDVGEPEPAPTVRVWQRSAFSQELVRATGWRFESSLPHHRLGPKDDPSSSVGLAGNTGSTYLPGLRVCDAGSMLLREVCKTAPLRVPDARDRRDHADGAASRRERAEDD